MTENNETWPSSPEDSADGPENDCDSSSSSSSSSYANVRFTKISSTTSNNPSSCKNLNSTVSFSIDSILGHRCEQKRNKVYDSHQSSSSSSKNSVETRYVSERRTGKLKKMNFILKK